jgi:predicted choloylglycine hydrolase
MNIKKFSGTFPDIGRQEGEIYRQNGMDLNRVKIDQELFRKQLKVYEKYYPELLQEFEGMAEAGKFDKDKLIYHFIAGQILFHIERFNLHKSCTIFGVQNQNGVFVGRNYDWHPVTEQVFQAYRVENPERNLFLGFSDMGIGGLEDSSLEYQFHDADDALNNRGLFIGLTFAFADEWSYGLVSTHLIKLIAETCTTVDDALKVFEMVPTCCPKNFFLADKNGNMAVVEHTSKRYKIVRPENGILIQTNHYVDSELTKEDTVLAHVPGHNTFSRYNEVLQRVANLKEQFTFADIMGILGTPGTHVCQNYPDIKTIWSLAMDMQAEQYQLYWDLLGEKKSQLLKV